MAESPFHVAGGPDEEQLEQFHRTVLRVLDEIGVEVGVPALLEAAAGEPTARVEGTRVRLAPEVVERSVAGYRERHGDTASSADRFTIDILTGFAFQDLDPFTDRLEPMTTERCIRTARLVDTLHDRGVRGGTPGLPRDVPPQLREILAYRIGCQNSRTAAHVGVSSSESAEVVYEMSRVAGLSFDLPAFVLSPLRVAGESVELALDFLASDRDVRVFLTAMPLLGVTAPLDVSGAFVQHVAGVLAGYTLFDLMGLAERVEYHFSVYPFDMKFGTIAYGTPRHVLAHLFGVRVNRYYGADTRTCKAFHTNALRPDAHSISQRAAFGALAALSGARNFTFGGMLGIDKIFSAEQLLIDVEIVEYLEHLVGGLESDEAARAFEVIDAVGPGGDFLTHPGTLAGYRDLWISDLFENLSPEQWSQRKGTTLRERLRRRVGELLDSYSYEPDPAIVAELDRIYESAVARLR
ncbi:MAG: trimethylamine methyltransferase family protein [Candidatus Brocadiaceae bacterium]|jgi:trimethylamine--corrinoid protein Co-methyltransferase